MMASHLHRQRISPAFRCKLQLPSHHHPDHASHRSRLSPTTSLNRFNATRQGEFLDPILHELAVVIPVVVPQQPPTCQGLAMGSPSGPSSARTNPGLGATAAVDSLPSAGIRAVVELTAAGIAVSCRIVVQSSLESFAANHCSVLPDALALSPPVAPPSHQPAAHASQRQSTSTTLHHLPAQPSSRPLPILLLPFQP
ncbi:uncharacterized protein BDV14DRAFT_111521 [Aspergillus stella-maris]|uniref:uncharacterized protein n=1 Tax=Aspergillus stella-maris TaxID=1810926 RepID=UPI003CCD7A0E